MNTLRIGIDIGGVCAKDSYNYENSDQDQESIINMPNCVSSLEELKKQGHYLVLVSFCGRKRAENNRRLNLVDHFNESYFVKKRPYKARVCQIRALDVLIDDRSDILATITKPTVTVKFGRHPSDRFCKYKPDHHVESWEEFLKLVPKLVQQRRYRLQERSSLELIPFIY